ncbi:STAS domain-containing protein [Streptomyces fodineus]|uniref:STAS domain-containing protein n=1 Tax=Streptomyces fodineus TaxID=1904616 RepID=UPI0009A136E4|nr:STAS domain-containing protein [Streptomyces fodineus]
MQHPSYRARSVTTPGFPGPGGGAAAKPLLPGQIATSYASSDDRVYVTVRGELDLVSGHQLRDQLSDALAASSSGLDLDLSGLSFCDCAGLNVLLELRQRALSRNKTVVIQDASAAIGRLLDLTGARDLFASREGRRCACSQPRARAVS